MLTISLDRVVDLLDKAAEVELPEGVLVEERGEAMSADADEAADEVLAGDPAYQTLREAITALNPDEAYELLALALWERNAADLDEWQAMVEQARAIPEDEVPGELADVLILTDDIELALERIGYIVEDEEDGEDGEDEEAEDESTGKGDEQEEGRE